MSRTFRLLDHPAICLSLTAFALHLWVNGSYGYFRDELYFIVCGRHPAWGYTDQPPLTPLLAAASEAVFHSLRGLRLVPAIASAATVALTVSTARMLGGGLYACWLAGLSVLAGGVLQLCGVLMITDTLQPLAWLACGVCIVRAEQDEEPRWWLAAGAIAGIAFLAKYTVASTLAPSPWVCLQRPSVACSCAGSHGRPSSSPRRSRRPTSSGRRRTIGRSWPTPPCWRRIRTSRSLLSHSCRRRSSRSGLPLLRSGSRGSRLLLSGRGFAHLRWVAVSWVVLIAAAVAGRGRPYYLAGAYPLLMAGGATALEAWLPRLLKGAFAAVVLAAGVFTAPLFLPVLPIESFIAYQHALGLTPSTGERLKLGVLPQYYADMFGWPQLAEAVGKAYQALPPEDRQRAVFFGRNYGEAAAVDFFGAPWGLPPAISAHKSYFLWGPRGHDGSVMLTLWPSRDELLKSFRSVEPVGFVDNPLGMPEESGQTLWLCRDSVEPLQEAWPRLRHYD